MFATLAVVMAASLIGPLLAAGRRPIVPVVVGEIGAGLILGTSGFGLIDPSVVPLPSLSTIGFILLMFSAGANIDVASPTFRAGAKRGLAALVLTLAASVPGAFLLVALSGVGAPAWIAVLLAGSSAAVAFPIMVEQRLDRASIASLLAWIALADSVTVVLLPLAIGSGGSPLAAIAADTAIWRAARFQVGGLALTERRVPTALAASAQLGLPSAAATLGLQSGALSPALAAALVGAALLTLIPATIGSLRLAADAAERRNPDPGGTEAPG